MCRLVSLDSGAWALAMSARLMKASLVATFDNLLARTLGPFCGGDVERVPLTGMLVAAMAIQNRAHPILSASGARRVSWRHR